MEIELGTGACDFGNADVAQLAAIVEQVGQPERLRLALAVGVDILLGDVPVGTRREVVQPYYRIGYTLGFVCLGHTLDQAGDTSERIGEILFLFAAESVIDCLALCWAYEGAERLDC